MSDERLDQLGIPRRRFLKRSAAAAFAAPVVVSFALDGVAEGQTSSRNGIAGDQRCTNQAFPNQSYVENELMDIIYEAVNSLGCELSRKHATVIAHLALNAVLDTASVSTSMCKSIHTLIKEIESLPSSETRTQLLERARTAQSAAGCKKG